MQRKVVISVGLALLTLAAYWQVGRLDFVSLDDATYASENPHVQKGLTWDGIRWAFSTGQTANWHPLTWLSLMLDGGWFGRQAAGYHSVNVAFHVANTLILFLVLCGMTRATWRSAAVAALFALHPLHVESVAWVAERKDVLSTFLGLLSLAAYVGYVRRPGLLRYTVVLVLFALALMAKPMLVTLPLIFLLLDYWPLERWRGGTRAQAGSSKKNHAGPLSAPFPPERTALWLVAEKAPLLVLSAASCVITYCVQQASGAVASIERLSLGLRLQNALVSYVVYIRQMFWPTDLAVFYPLREEVRPDWAWGAAAVLAAFSLVALWGARRGHRWLAVGWAWYLGMLVPAIGLVQVGRQGRADRYTYLPLVGLFLVAVWGAAELAKRWRMGSKTAALAGAAALAACAMLTARQVGYWADSETLFRRALAVTEDNAIACDDLALYLYGHGETAEARQYWEKALKIRPNDLDALHNLALLLVQEKRYDEAARQAEKTLRLYPLAGVAHNTLGRVRMAQGRTDEALEHFQEAHRLDPENTTVLANLAKFYLLKEDLDLAAENWQEVLRLKPEDLEAGSGLAEVRVRQGRVEEAADLLGQLVARQPKDPVVRNELAVVLTRQGKYQEAIAEWSNLLAADPRDVVAMNGVAWVLSTSQDASIRDGKKATGMAENAVEITARGDPEALDTLAAAYAEAGQFSKAVATATEALTLADRQGKKALAAELRDRLELYRGGSPYREAAAHPGIGSAP